MQESIVLAVFQLISSSKFCTSPAESVHMKRINDYTTLLVISQQKLRNKACLLPSVLKH